MNAMIRVLIAEDQHMIRGALVALLDLEDDLTVVASVDRGDLVVGAVVEHLPDVAVLDIEMPGLDGLSVAEQLVDEHPSCRVLILTGLGKPHHVHRAMQLHVQGFLPKDAPPDQLAEAIRTIAAGGRVVDPKLVAHAFEVGLSPLTPRESEVLAHATSGATTREIGITLALSPATVRNYLSNSIAKLGARNRHDAARIARAAGWIE